MPTAEKFYQKPGEREAIFKDLAYDSALFNGAQNWTIEKEVGKRAYIISKTPTIMAGTSPQYAVRIYSYWKGILLQSLQTINFLSPSSGLLGGSIEVPTLADTIKISISKTGTHTGGSLSVFMKEF